MTEDTKQTVEYVIGRLQAAAESLEPGARHVYEVLVRQAWITGLVDTAMCVGGLVAFVSLLRWLPRNWDRVERAGDGAVIATIVMSICVGIAAIISFVCFGQSLAHLVNPEYYALKDILGAL